MANNRDISEHYFELIGKQREDGFMFVTSPNLRLFSAVVPDRDWDAVLELARRYIEKNVGPVKSLRLIPEIPEGPAGEQTGRSDIPPAHVLADLAAA